MANKLFSASMLEALLAKQCFASTLSDERGRFEQLEIRLLASMLASSSTLSLSPILAVSRAVSGRSPHPSRERCFTNPDASSLLASPAREQLFPSTIMFRALTSTALAEESASK